MVKNYYKHNYYRLLILPYHIISQRAFTSAHQITKLFGVNYDTPTNIQIHTSASQLSAPGSYMLAPSYSEALLMEPAAPRLQTNSITSPNTSSQRQQHHQQQQQQRVESDMVPSYSEALLYERISTDRTSSVDCECLCHSVQGTETGSTCASRESLLTPEVWNEADNERRDRRTVSFIFRFVFSYFFRINN